MPRPLSFLLAALCWLCGAAQTPKGYIFSVRRYGVAEGLPQRVVNSIAQDRQGFIWLATPTGLVRFDGYTFLNHTRANGLSKDAVKTVVRDADGQLWLWYADNSADLFDPRTGACSPIQEHFAGRTPAPSDLPVQGIEANDDGLIAFYQEGQLMRYRSAKQGLERIPLDCDVIPAPRRVEKNGDVWCFCNGIEGAHMAELMRVGASATDILARIPDVKRLANTGHDLWTSGPSGDAGLYLWRAQGQGWSLADGTLIDLKDGTDTTVAHSMWNGIIRLELADGLWLVNTTVRRMQAEDDPLKAPVLFDIADAYPEASHFMHDVLCDRAGNVWIGGAFGLFKLTMTRDVFQRWLWNSDPGTIVGTNIRGMALVNGRLHVNSEYTGYWTLDASSGAVIASRNSADYGLGIIPDGDGGTWRSANRSILHTSANGTDVQRYEVTRYAQGAWSMLPLGPDRLLLGTLHGLVLAGPVPELKELTHAAHPELDDAAVWHLQRDRSGGILACTQRGLYALNDDGAVVDHWDIEEPPVNGVPHALPTDDIRHFHEDSTGLFWLATATNGLVRWDRRTGRTRTIGVREGLPATSIHAVYPDGSGSLWLPTDNGLVRYDPITGQVKVFTTADGITNNEFNRIAHAQGPDGRLFFGGFNGITVVDPAQLRTGTNTPAANLVLKTVQQQEADQAGLTDRTLAVLDGGPIVVRPGDRSFTVGMALLCYDDPAQIRYAWRIDGIDKDWNRQVEPLVRFHALPYGEHTLRIIAFDANGRQSANELSLPIHVVRPLYLRWWAIALCILLVAALVYVLVQYRLRQLRRVIQVRDRIAMDLHDEVGSSLSGIVLFSAAVNTNTDGLSAKASNMLERIADNSTRAMESMNDIVWSVNSAHDQLGDVLDRMRAYAEPLCEAAGIALHFTVAEGITGRKLGMAERKSLYLIFKEAVNNAVKHAQCDRLDVDLRASGRSITLVVADDGKGMQGHTPTEASLGGNGLGNMHRRAGDSGGRLEHRARAGGGTEVVLHITTGRS